MKADDEVEGVLILIIAALVFLAALTILSGYLAHFLAKPHHSSLSETEKEERRHAELWGGYDSFPHTDYTVASADGYVLHAQMIPAEKPSRKFVVISHGYTVNRNNSVKYACLYRALGYQCILYDDRGHGENVPCKCTLGVVESRDLIAVIDDARRRWGKDISIGLHGESMGAGLQIMALRYHPDVRFIVSDCGYADLRNVLEGGLKHIFHLPGWLVFPASLMCRICYGYSFRQCRPIDELKGNRVPICFIHGEADTFISKSNSERMHAAAEGYSELHLFPGAEHAQSFLSDPARYRSTVAAFLAKADP
jgi:pimeloyl-ACP methyl ester carboxylesterase